jgi:hypothetical protein
MATSCFLQLATQKLASLSNTSPQDKETFDAINTALQIILENAEGLLNFEDQSFISKITESTITLQNEK